MKHVAVCEYGSSVGVSDECVTIKVDGKIAKKYPLSRLHSITIAKPGVSLSSNLVIECADHGVRVFFMNGIGECVAALSGIKSHGVGQTRRRQILFLEDAAKSAELAMRVTYGKIRNQRAVLKYFAKSYGAKESGVAVRLNEAADALAEAADNAVKCHGDEYDCRASLLGIEGYAATVYWKAWVDTNLYPPSFRRREGRGSLEPVNAALNYGYGILASRIWNALLVAGLEPYLGFYHVERPGKPSLVLDLMEEYRSWCVDRVVAKNRSILSGADALTPMIRRRIVDEILAVFSTEYTYKGGKTSLDSILQRQVYRLVGHFNGTKAYKPYLFKW